MRILLVEDSKPLAQSLRVGLSRLGFSVAVAVDGETGARMAVGGNFDAVVLDLMLPGVPGLEILRRIARRDRQQLPL